MSCLHSVYVKNCIYLKKFLKCHVISESVLYPFLTKQSPYFVKFPKSISSSLLTLAD